MALLILVPEENRASLEKALDTFAPFDWATRLRDGIRLFPIDPGARQETDGLCAYCQRNDIEEILIPKRVHAGEERLRDAGYRVTMGPGIRELIQGRGLQKELERVGLDWRSAVSRRLESFGLEKIGRTEMDRWLAQFERLGNHRTIGEHLLQLLDVLSLSDLAESLSADSGFYGDALIVGFSNDKWGKSWATVSNLIGKTCPSAVLLPVGDAIQAAADAHSTGRRARVLWLVEDGLFSGREMRSILESLSGKRPPGRVEKVPKLSDPRLLSTIPIQLRFSVVCDFGDAVLRHYTAGQSLPNVQVSLGSSRRTIRVLINPGEPEKDSTNEPHTADRELDHLRSRVVPFAFQEDKGWRDASKRLRARRFCETIGEQLWSAYIRTKKDFDAAAWPDARIKRCSLGMENLGLTFAFPHSVPKATLPVFWAAGNVTYEGVSLDWRPLFPGCS